MGHAIGKFTPVWAFGCFAVSLLLFLGAKEGDNSWIVFAVIGLVTYLLGRGYRWMLSGD